MGFVGQHAVSGELSFGASQTLAEYLVPDLIAQLDEEFTQLTIKLAVDNSRHIVRDVLDCQYDLGVIEGRCDNERLSQQPWCSDELLIVVGKDHALAHHKTIELSELNNEKWVLREKGAGTRDIFDHKIHQTLDSLNVWREYNHVPTLIALVKSGKYISCLPQSSVADALNKGDLVALNCTMDEKPLIMKRTFTFIWRKTSADHPLIKTVLVAAGNKPV
jgi:DNA-binding transcriptional LysR family regulator